ncbi:hypothetical protein [Pseudoruegeria sp. HB172150]|uniref:hypothetical protein n=1 Tax=Pseudoruegeria sp. HB172150 TaxID=2721164 RepID=UPI00155333EF|nr:hypothetical protein [Pseudoruegeria sp. HB172150]
MQSLCAPSTLGWLALGGLCACAPSDATDGAAESGAFTSDYRGIETRLLEDDLVEFRVAMTGARNRADVSAYADCAAAQYALIRGYGFARHVRTNIEEEGGLWRGDAVYTISPALPRGLATIDAEVAVANCAETGIPTV